MKTAQWNAFHNAPRCFRWTSQSERSGEQMKGGVGLDWVEHGAANQNENTVQHVQETCPIRCIRDRVLVRIFPAMQMLLIHSEVSRLDPNEGVGRFRCHALAFQSWISSAPCTPGCPRSTLWWFDSHKPRSPEPPETRENNCNGANDTFCS